MFKKLLLTAGSILIMSTAATNAQANEKIEMEVSTGGTVTIELLPDIAPNHVERIKKLAGEGFYDGIVFHRVIGGFMAQTGDPTGTGMGASEEPDLKAEFSDYPYKRGTVGMARSGHPDSANSQFFICFTDNGCSFLTGEYTVWGQVTDGMDFIDAVAKGEPPASPDNIVSMKIVTEDIAVAPETSAPEAETIETVDESVNESVDETHAE